MTEGDRFDAGELRKVEEEIADLRREMARDLERVERLAKADLQSKAKPAAVPAVPAGVASWMTL